MSSKIFVQLVLFLVFDGYHDNWGMLMKNYLRFKEYWLVVFKGIIEPILRITIMNM
jgi:hypothetical protein